MTIIDKKKEWLQKSDILVQALPYMQKYRKTFVIIKIGGKVFQNPKVIKGLAHDIALLHQIGCYPILVHGGAIQVETFLEKLNIKSSFLDGMRITDSATMEVVEMVLGKVNKSLVASICKLKGMAVGLSGKDAKIIIAKQLKSKDGKDLGMVGSPAKINTHLLTSLCLNGFIPVVAPISCDEDGNTYNINSDLVAGEIASALQAKRLLYLSDISGVLDENKNVLPHLNTKAARLMIETGVVKSGMIPKLNTCISVVEKGVASVVILDGLIPHIVLLEMFTDYGAGTLISC